MKVSVSPDFVTKPAASSGLLEATEPFLPGVIPALKIRLSSGRYSTPKPHPSTSLQLMYCGIGSQFLPFNENGLPTFHSSILSLKNVSLPT